VSSAAYAVAKLALDATIQRRVDDATRTSTFARSETTMQLSWVVGGGIGILLPTSAGLGFGVATAVLFAGLLVAMGIGPWGRPASGADESPAGFLPGAAVAEGPGSGVSG
jgi:hypothetical protein